MTPDEARPILPSRLETERLVLRAPLAADAATIFDAYAQDVDVARYLMWRPHTTLAMTERFIDDCIATFATGARLPYVLARREAPDRAIGMLEARPVGHRVDLGYVLAPSAGRGGLMPEAVRALADRALEAPTLFRVQAFCDVDNLASQRVLEKAGFAREGRHERFNVHPNAGDEPRACFMYARCR